MGRDFILSIFGAVYQDMVDILNCLAFKPKARVYFGADSIDEGVIVVIRTKAMEAGSDFLVWVVVPVNRLEGSLHLDASFVTAFLRLHVVVGSVLVL